MEPGANKGCADADRFARRDFLKLTSAAAAGFLLSRVPIAAGPFTREDFDKLVPADKKLDSAWVKSLFERGEPTVYRGAELDKIGMPVGGICAGQLYLGGDGRLWHWDIFNQNIRTAAEHYAQPLSPAAPLEQGFALRVTAGSQTQTRKLDRASWRDVTFNGQYPVGHVEYRDPDSPVAVALEAFSPFIPLNVDDSSLPATVMRFKLTNTSRQKTEVELSGWLENAVALKSGEIQDVLRHNRIVRRDQFAFLECSASEPPARANQSPRPDIVFDDFERETYAPWTTEGDAFGSGPIQKGKVPEYQGDLAMHGQHAVNSHSSAPREGDGGPDGHTGTLTSPPFTIERDFIRFLVGGGAHPTKAAVRLVVDGKVVHFAAGTNDNKMKPVTWGVRRWAGKTARFQVVDNDIGGWGNIGFDYIVFTDKADVPAGSLVNQPDFGTMGLTLIGGSKGSWGIASLPDGTAPPQFSSNLVRESGAPVTKGFNEPNIGSLSRRLSLKPGQTGEIIFVLTWHFPKLELPKLPPGRHYATRFPSALAVAEYVAANFARLASQTRLWHDTWYDSTLPYWFLDRTFLNASILATSTCYRLANGRFWGWEGVGCCAGTCGHVWQYAHAVARLFPEIERDTRERVDFGLALQPDGAIHFRAEHNNIPAIDAQAGTVLRALREHQMCRDDAWLKQNWPAIRKSIEWLIARDENGDGLIESNQHNTLDTDWFGPVAWLSGMYLAALRAGEEMAREIGDESFAQRCHAVFERGKSNLVAQLFDGEYFINKPDPKHLDAINSGSGCEIDQVFGQSWAFQVGLPRVLPEAETVSALKSLWRYNFTPDVGPYRDAYKPGRWYAMAGEGGLLMCTFPRRDWDYSQAKGKGAEWAAGYFNECMNGFEYQVAGHMLWEGMTLEGLAITRMLHDRYHASRRNPWNEVECGDHYARSMASYGVYLAACGFSYHGHRGHIGFATRLTPENFKCAFTSAEGWGSFAQQRSATKSDFEIALHWGKLKLRKLSLALAGQTTAAKVRVKVNHRNMAASFHQNGSECVVTLNRPTEIKAGGRIQVSVPHLA